MLKKLRRKIESGSFNHAVIFAVRRLFDSLFRSGKLFFRCDLSQCDSSPANDDIRIQEKKGIHQITGHEKQVLLHLGGSTLFSEFEKRIERGDRLFTAYINDEIVGLCWASLAKDRSFYSLPLSDSIPLPEKSFMVTSSYTLDKFRKKGVSTTLFQNILLVMKQEGYEWAFGVTTAWNFNKKTFLKVGFKMVARFHEFEVGGRSVLIWTLK